jgi:DNA-binding Lrp family transcriptional regulator
MRDHVPASTGINQTTSSLAIPFDSEMIRLHHQLGVVHLKGPPVSSERLHQTPVALELLEGSLLREYIEQWIRNKCEPVAFSSRAFEIQITPTSRAIAEKTLISAGYLLQAPSSDPHTKFEPTSKAIEWMWQTPRIRSSLSGLVGSAESSADGSILYRDARHAILAVISRFEHVMILNTTSLSSLLNWSTQATQAWLKKTIGTAEIQLNSEKNGVALSPSGHQALQALGLQSTEVTPAEPKSRKKLDHEDLRKKIPHVIAGLVQLTGFTKGISCHEIASALGIPRDSLRGSRILESLVAEGVLARTSVRLNPHDSELCRFKAESVLFVVIAPHSVPETSKLQLETVAAQMKLAAEKNRPTGEQFSDPKTGYCIEAVKSTIAEFRGEPFSQSDLRQKLIAKNIYTGRDNILQRTVVFLESTGFLTSHSTKRNSWSNRHFTYTETNPAK